MILSQTDSRNEYNLQKYIEDVDPVQISDSFLIDPDGDLNPIPILLLNNVDLVVSLLSN